MNAERRDLADRRRRIWWSLLYGSFNPRRRRVPRREREKRFHYLDWHAPHLLGVALGILLLSAADAFATVSLLAGGATELNPVMAAVIAHSALTFAGVKMLLTGISVVALVLLSRHRFLRIVRVEVMMYAVLVLYVLLLRHEVGMLGGLL